MYKKLPGIYRGKKSSSPIKAVDKELVEGAYTGPGKEKEGTSLSDDQAIWDRLAEKDKEIDSAKEVVGDDGEVIAKAGSWKAYRLNKKSGKDTEKEDMKDKHVNKNSPSKTNNDTDNTKVD